jgi:hypothetical protein
MALPGGGVSGLKGRVAAEHAPRPTARPRKMRIVFIATLLGNLRDGGDPPP